MARGKNAPALFEVIRNAQEKQRLHEQRLRQQSSPAAATSASLTAPPAGNAGPSTRPAESSGMSAANLLKSPLFWFKGRSAHDAVVGQSAIGNASSPIEPVMREVRRSPDEPRSTPTTVTAPVAKPARDATARAEAVDGSPSAAAPAPAYRPAIAEHARQVREEIAAQEAPAAEPFFQRPAYSSPADVKPTDAYGSDQSSSSRHGRPEFAIDRDRRQISMRLSYNAAIIAAFAVVVACGLAYLIGSAGKPKTVAVADSTPQSGVMDVQPGKIDPVANTDKPSENGSSEAGNEARAAQGAHHGETAIDNGGKPIDVPTDVNRVVGLQYVVVYSSPLQQDVNQVVKFLADNGIAATAERALPGYSAAWYSVVSARGFEKISKNPLYDVYVANLVKLMQKFSRQTQKFVAGKPAAYTWKIAK